MSTLGGVSPPSLSLLCCTMSRGSRRISCHPVKPKKKNKKTLSSQRSIDNIYTFEETTTRRGKKTTIAQPEDLDSDGSDAYQPRRKRSRVVPATSTIVQEPQSVDLSREELGDFQAGYEEQLYKARRKTKVSSSGVSV